MANKMKIYKRLLKSENKTWKEFGEDLLSLIKGNFMIEEIEDNYAKIAKEPQAEFLIEIRGDEVFFSYDSNTEFGGEDITLFNCGPSSIPEKGIHAHIEKVSVCHAEDYIDIKRYKNRNLIFEDTVHLEPCEAETISPESFLPEVVDSYIIINRDEWSPA